MASYNTHNTKVVPKFCVSSLVVYLDKVSYEAKEIRSWSSDQQQQYNPNTFKGWQKCSNSYNSVPDGTYRVWPLLAHYLKHESHNMSWMWEHHNSPTVLDPISRGSGMSSYSIPCKWCGNHIVFDNNITSRNGVRKPLNEWNHQIHNCPISPYNKVRAPSTEEKVLSKQLQWEIIDQLKEQIAATSNRLSNYELRLDVMTREDI